MSEHAIDFPVHQEDDVVPGGRLVTIGVVAIVIGTLGVLKEAATLGLLDLRACVARLQTTTFYVAPEVLKNLLGE